jgi:phosphoglycerate dehydrogenase-like enzyme
MEALPPGVIVANTYHHERAIAEHALMSMVALSRRLLAADDHLRQGLWDSVFFNPATPMNQTLRGRTVGLVGYGHIGREIARLCRCFDMRVGAVRHSPESSRATQDELEFVGGPATLPELLRWSDFVVVAAPITAETRGMIGREELALMKPTAYLINVGRGAIVDEAALYGALAEQRLAGAALDVWYKYPAGGQPALPASLPFHQLDNVILTPHNSGLADETFRGRAKDVAENVDRLALGRALVNVVRAA